MTAIHIISESAPVGQRLRDILYQAGFSEISVSGITALTEAKQNAVQIVYAKTNIPAVMQNAAAGSGSVILLLNPDCYAMYLDRARHAGIRLLLMPVEPYRLLEAVEAIS
jgi:hypothetical protein